MRGDVRGRSGRGLEGVDRRGPLVRMFAPKMRRDIAASLAALEGQLSR
jgi:hypothetical protein